MVVAHEQAVVSALAAAIFRSGNALCLGVMGVRWTDQAAGDWSAGLLSRMLARRPGPERCLPVLLAVQAAAQGRPLPRCSWPVPVPTAGRRRPRRGGVLRRDSCQCE